MSRINFDILFRNIFGPLVVKFVYMTKLGVDILKSRKSHLAIFALYILYDFISFQHLIEPVISQKFKMINFDLCLTPCAHELTLVFDVFVYYLSF